MPVDRPLPSDLVAFFAGAVADLIVEDTAELLRRRPEANDADHVRGLIAAARTVSGQFHDNPGLLARFGHTVSKPEDLADVRRLVEDLAKMGDVDAGVSVGFMRAGLRLSRARLQAAIAGALMTHGGYRVD